MARTLCIALLAALTGACQSAPPKLRADAELERGFRTSREAFETLARMAREDRAIWRIAKDFVSVSDASGKPRRATEQDLSKARTAEYRALFLRAELNEGMLRERQGILFPADIREIGSDSIEKGYALLAESPSDIRVSLDTVDLAAHKPRTLYKRLDGNWYLYARYNE